MTKKIIITGAAGLVGQNLIARLKAKPDIAIVGIDKHPTNTALLRRIHPEIDVIEADLAKPGAWTKALADADALVLNQAQIGGLVEQDFIDNNVTATKLIVAAMCEHQTPYFVHISSSVVNSRADDFYTRTKTEQERFIDTVEIPHVVLRPTLMFGWFDRKHLGWLRRFMDKAPIFPIPGDGKFIRQPLYVGDFAAIIASSLESRITGTYDISGLEQIDYGALIRLIHDIVKPKARIVHIPYCFVLGVALHLCQIRSQPAFHYQSAGGFGHSRDVSRDRLAGHFRCRSNTAATGIGRNLSRSALCAHRSRFLRHMRMARIAVIGAGPMGLAAAHRAVTLGHEVDLVEADNKPGGMAAHFDFGGLSIERYYHFVCKSDAPTFALLKELGLNDAMRWTPTSMGYFIKGKVHPWGDPIALLGFPHLDMVSKIRTGLQMFLTTKHKEFGAIEALTARQWLERGSGKRVYETLWKRLLELKFYELADDISASWIATRVRRVGTSRRSMFQEELGYIEGGTQTLVDALIKAFEAKGGRLHLATPAEKVETADGRVTGVTAGGRLFPADAVISTVPTPLVSKLVPDLPADWRSQI